MAKDESVRSLGEFLKEMSARTGRQVVLISHDAEIFQYADKVFMFESGPNKSVVVKELEAHEEA
jgi:DNA repair exonuclease SbcCD ATPase subunit